MRNDLFTGATADRILARPETGKAERSLKLCRRNGTSEFVKITKCDAQAFKRAKKKDWGDEYRGVLTLPPSGH